MFVGITNHIELKRLDGNWKEWRTTLLKPTCVGKNYECMYSSHC